MALPPAELEQIYVCMARISAADRQLCATGRRGGLTGPYYPVRGLEGVCAALGLALDPSDHLVSTYRNLGDAIAKGLSLNEVFCEIQGRSGGTSKGKGGSMHLSDPDKGLMATTGIVGGGLPLAVGLGLAAQQDATGRVAAVTFGDGATSIGAFHESMAMAALWDLPVVFVCQNNQWGEHTAITAYTSQPDLTARATAYGMRSVALDGFDPVATYEGLAEAVAHARAGDGPTLAVCDTYRLSGHTATADTSYVPADELAQAELRDPTPTFRRWLIENGHLSAETAEAIDARAEEEIKTALAFAEASPPPDISERFTDVYAETTPMRTHV